MTHLLLSNRHPSTPLRMTIFAVLDNQLLGQPQEVCRPQSQVAEIAPCGDLNSEAAFPPVLVLTFYPQRPTIRAGKPIVGRTT